MHLIVTRVKSKEMGYTNHVYLGNIPTPSFTFLSIDTRLFAYTKQHNLSPNEIYINGFSRTYLNVQENTSVEIDFVPIKNVPNIQRIKLTFEIKNIGQHKFMKPEVISELLSMYQGMPFNSGQVFSMVYQKYECKVTVTELVTDDDNGSYNNLSRVSKIENGVSKTSNTKDKNLSNIKNEMTKDNCNDINICGVLLHTSDICLESASRGLEMIGEERCCLLKDGIDYEKLGIGGLKQEFSQMFRRAFVQRIFQPEVIKQLGISHLKGILLYGPPGTGKTLIARQIGTMLNARTPKIVNGPEILNKYVGQSEENIRNLFKDAEDEYKSRGANSALHIIIFDELDAVFRQRGTSSNNVGDQVVNQLLSKMDGVEALDNILVIGMTNRKDLIDSALLRPGRFEMHIEISLPDEKSRHDIFKIHTNRMVENNYVDEGVDLEKMARLTRNYTGAEIAATVKSAVSFALERNVHQKEGQEDIKMEARNDVHITMNDFMSALEEVKPSYGFNENDFSNFDRRYYEIKIFTDIMSEACSHLKNLRQTTAYKTSSIILYGESGAGKTTLAVKIALQSDYPFIKLISPKNLVGLSEYEKVNYIKDVFMDAYRSNESIVILDDIEMLIEYVSLGPRFSNNILQALKIYIKNEEKNKLCIIGVTSFPDVIRECGLMECFFKEMYVDRVDAKNFQMLKEQSECFNTVNFTKPVPIKSIISQIVNDEKSNL